MHEIRIYVADLAAYNIGQFHGVWIDATESLESIQGKIRNMLACSPEENAEEYAVHDYDGFDGYSLAEYKSLETIHEIACFIEMYPGIVGELLNHFGGHLDDARKAVEECYAGLYKSVAEYAGAFPAAVSGVAHCLPYSEPDFEMLCLSGLYQALTTPSA